MYQPRAFEETRIAVLHDLIRRYPLATLVTTGPDGPEADHIPLHLAHDGSFCGVLQGHVARANPIWQNASKGEVLVIFHGPQRYISPSWYATKTETGKVVPTWNYVVVHAHGPLLVHDDPAWVRAQMEILTQAQESGFAQPWGVSDAPADFTERLIQQVVGMEIPISRLIGKWKVSQNQPLHNRHSVIAHLQQDEHPFSREMAELIRFTLENGEALP